MSQQNSEELEISLNPKQHDFLSHISEMQSGVVKGVGMIGGRGSGKSVTLSDLTMMMVQELPKAKIQMACGEVSKAKRSLTPQLKAGWDRWGYSEYNWKTGAGEYVLWREPPDTFDRPYQAPDDWENCISFPNGLVFEYVGYRQNADANRGPNYDGLVIDEAAFFKEEWLKIAVATVRANPRKFDSPFHWLFAFFSSPPWRPEGQWVYKYQELARQEPKKYYFMEVWTRDNQMFLPPDYIDNMKKSLQKIVYEVEVEGRRITRLPKSFYPSFDWEKHCDIDDVFPYYKPDEPVEISVDFNAHFTCCSIWQPDYQMLKQVKDCFVKEAEEGLTMAKSLAKKVVADLADHEHKVAYVTGDRNGNSKHAGASETMFEQFAEILEAAGWEVILDPLDYNPDHQDKYVLVNDVYEETKEDEYTVRHDPVECKDTIVSIQNSPITHDYKKDKRSEKSDSIDQERATHLSDTVDYYIIWKKQQGYSSGGSIQIDFI
ncbi:terminase large subunit domain-containing protein [Tellurirhabdus rosea]|uniref:terminase large subunit domain-containing protein n=1 Tax=Tellurirhabdus rosea TaxID=2674997 RepID=UPI0022504CB7|nr:terminase family protein [Tellurirhabdus rosea]